MSQTTNKDPVQDQKEFFYRLVAEWKGRNPFSSNPMDIWRDPAYLAIIAMGFQAVPWILFELEKEVDQWFLALEVITGKKNMVLPEDKGNLDLLAAAWLKWGRDKSLI